MPRPRRAAVALGLAVFALLVVAVLPLPALVPATAAIVVGADARQRGLADGVRAHRMARVALTVGAIAFAVALALVLVALSGA